MIDLASLRVLVVEDHEACRDGLMAALASEGVTVVALATGRDGIARARRQTVITDLGLPDIPGARVIRDIVAAAMSPRAWW